MSARATQWYDAMNEEQDSPLPVGASARVIDLGGEATPLLELQEILSALIGELKAHSNGTFLNPRAGGERRCSHPAGVRLQSARLLVEHRQFGQGDAPI